MVQTRFRSLGHELVYSNLAAFEIFSKEKEFLKLKSYIQSVYPIWFPEIKIEIIEECPTAAVSWIYLTFMVFRVPK